MSYEEYLKYKKDGVNPHKFSWVKKAWDNLDLTEKQYLLIRKNSLYNYFLGIGLGTMLGVSISAFVVIMLQII